MPREIDLREVQWLTITPENYEEQFAIIEAQEGELVFLAMTIPDYETCLLYTSPSPRDS